MGLEGGEKGRVRMGRREGEGGEGIRGGEKGRVWKG